MITKYFGNNTKQKIKKTVDFIPKICYAICKKRKRGVPMEYMKVSQAAQKWGISPRRVRLLCAQNRIEGAIQVGKLYMIPQTASKPVDGRRKGDTLSAELSLLLDRIDALKKELDSKRPLTVGETERLREQFMIDYTYNSNAIEGNTLTLKETAMVLEGMTIDQKPLKDHLEVVGHRDAFLYVEDIAKDTKISEFVIKNIHSLVLLNRPEDKGTYRKIPVTIMGAYTEPVQPYMIEPRMSELLSENEKRKKKMHAIERISRFHLEFEGIHPFIDGNGRCGRLILNLDLIQNGYPAINVKFADRKKYYEAFDAFYQNDTAEPMIELVAQYVIERLTQYLEILK